MKELDAKVVELLNNEPLWWIGTSGADVNVVPVGFKAVTEDGKLAIGAVFLNHTLENVATNGNVTIAAGGSKGMTAYQIKGTGKYITEGPIVDKFKAMADEMFKGQVTAKGALIVTPEKVIVATPGPKNNAEL